MENHKQDIREIREDIVNLHGEMVLLLNYSNVNYTGNSTLFQSKI